MKGSWYSMCYFVTSRISKEKKFFKNTPDFKLVITQFAEILEKK